MTGSKHCPSCRRGVDESDFQCPHCELLLVDFDDDRQFLPTNVSMVQALFEKPQAAARRGEAEPRTSTRERPRSAPLPALGEVPRVVSGLQLSRMSLSPIEAVVVGATDGRSTVRKLAGSVGISASELQIVIQGLAGIGVLTVAPPPLLGFEEEEEELEVSADMYEVVEDEEDDVAALPTVKFDLQEMQVLVKKQQERLRARQAPLATSASAAPASGPARPPARRKGSASAVEMAVKLERAGRGLEALRYLEMAISRSPDAAPLYNRLAIVLIRERLDFRSAEKMLLKAVELEPNHPVYKGNLLMVRQRRPIATSPGLAIPKRG